jgi:transketolase
MRALHLDKKINTPEMVKEPTRNGYGEGLVEAAKRDQNVVALAADLTESTRTLPFAEAYPDRFVQVGITEQNMASVASGMAAMGKIPFIASYAMFSPGRNWEQIRTTIAYNESNVKVVGAHAGVSVGPDGATHQAIEDMALMRVIPNMVVIAPADTHEARKATLAAAKYEGPVYIRLGRSNTPVVTTLESPFEIGKAEVMFESKNGTTSRIGIIVTGSLLFNALMAAEELVKEGSDVTVLHMPTIKPLDNESLLKLAKECVGLVTVEEHQRAGGLGGAVSEYLSEIHPIKIMKVGVDDLFGQSGEPDELVAHYGMDVKGIIRAAKLL